MHIASQILLLIACCIAALVHLSLQQGVIVDTRIAYSFGSNLRGQLGLIDSRVFQRVLSTLNVKDYCISADNVVAVTTTNEIYAWGVHNGQFGNVSSNALVDTPVKLTTTLTSIDQVACGLTHTLIRSGSDVYVVGFNTFAQLGSADTTLRYAQISSTAIAAGVQFSKIYAAGSTSFGVTAANALYAWGYNVDGQTGINTGTNNFVSTPTVVPALPSSVSRVESAPDFTVVLMTNGDVYASGSNFHGQLGIGNVIPPRRSSFAQIALPGAASLIAVGGNTVLAYIGTNLYGWGDNTCAQLGTTNATSFLSPIQIDTSALDSAIVAMTVSSQFTLVMTSSGKFYMLGRRSFGYSLSSDVTCQQVAMKTFTLISDFSSPAAHSKLLSSAENIYLSTTANILYATGLPSKSGLGALATSATQLNFANTKFDRVFAGYEMSAAYELRTGFAYGWGRNSDLAIVAQDNMDVYVPTLFKHSNISGVNITDVTFSGGVKNNNFYWNAMFLRNDTKALFGFGRNDVGQLATGSNNIIDPVAVPIQVDISNDTRVAKIANGLQHTIYLGYSLSSTQATTASMYGWGSNADGQLGLSQAASRPTRFRLRNNVKDFAVGDYHTVYVDTTNVIYVMGDNSKGQLGLGFVNRRSDPTPINSTRYSFLSNSTVVNLYGCSEGTFMITTLGWVVFGDNAFGALGLGNGISQVFEPVQHTILNALIPDPQNNVFRMSCAKYGGKHGLILVKSGEIYAFGLNNNGQLGTGDRITRFTPVKISLPTTISGLDVAAGRDHSLVLVGQRSCPNNCNVNRGKCLSVQGACECYPEYAGYDCSLFNCLDPLCNSRGTCDQTQGLCVCQAGFAGYSCQYRRCPNNCNGNGECNRSTGTCVCDPGFKNLDCGESSSFAFSKIQHASVWPILVAIIVLVASLIL